MQEALSMEYYGDSLEEISKLIRLYFIRTGLFFRGKLDRFYEQYYFSKKPAPITPPIDSGKLTLNNILNSSDRGNPSTGSFVAGSSKDRIKEKNRLSDKDFNGQVKTKNVKQPDLEDLIKKEIKLKITSEAFEKANYVSRRISELAGEKLELYFYLTNFHEKQEKGDIAVRDIFIAHKQKVYPNLVETHDTVTSQNIIINSLDQDIIGWGHSHGNHSNFHSDIDNESTNGTLAIHGIEYQFDFENNQDMPHLNRGRDKIYYTFSMVFNARNETPYCVLAYSLERFKSGKLIKEVPFEIIEEKNNIPFEKVDIDKQLLERVIIRGEESLLDIYSKKTGRSTEDILSNAGSLEPVGSYVGKKDEGQKKRDEEKDQRIALILTTSELRKAKKQFEEYQSTHPHTDPEYEALSTQNQELSLARDNFKKDKKALEGRLESIQSELAQKDKIIQEKKNEIEGYRRSEKEKSDYVKNISAAEKQIKELKDYKTTHSHPNEDYDKILGEKTSLESRLKIQEGTIQQQNEEIRKLKQKTGDEEKIKKETIENYKESPAYKEELEKRVEERVKGIYDQFEKKIENIKAEFNSKVDSIDKEFQDYVAVHSYTNEEHNQKSRKITELEGRVRELETEKTRLKQQPSEIEEEQIRSKAIDDYKQTEEYKSLEGTARRFNKLKAYCQDIINQNTESKRELREQKEKNARLEEEKDGLKSKLESSTNELKDYKSSHQHTDDEYAQLQKQNDDLDAKDKQKSSELLQIGEDLKNLGGRVSKLLGEGVKYAQTDPKTKEGEPKKEKTLTERLYEVGQEKPTEEKVQDKAAEPAEEKKQSWFKRKVSYKIIPYTIAGAILLGGITIAYHKYKDISQQLATTNQVVYVLKQKDKKLNQKHDILLKKYKISESTRGDITQKYDQQTKDFDTYKSTHTHTNEEYKALKQSEQERKAKRIYQVELKGDLEKIARNKGLWGIAEHFGIKGNRNIISFIKDISTSNNLKYNDTNNDGIGPDIWRKADLENGKFKISQYMDKKYNLNL